MRRIDFNAALQELDEHLDLGREQPILREDPVNDYTLAPPVRLQQGNQATLLQILVNGQPRKIGDT
jgi:hypothetical protein